jgi:hypothetical protein
VAFAMAGVLMVPPAFEGGKPLPIHTRNTNANWIGKLWSF